MTRGRAGRLTAAVALAACSALLSACGGGGGGGGGGDGAGTRATRFIGNIQDGGGAAAGAGGTIAGLGIVQVCVAGTALCTEVDDTGAFTLDARVGGDVVLLFDGPGFSARLALSDVPHGATVRIEHIVCSTRTGQCAAAHVEYLEPPNAPPDCRAAVAHPQVLWPPNHRMVSIRVAGVVDPDGDPLAITAVEAEQNEPVDASGSGNTAPDVRLSPLAVRAERSGQGDGRLYTIAFVVDDGRGGTCSGTVQVCVPHDRGRDGACP